MSEVHVYPRRIVESLQRFVHLGGESLAAPGAFAGTAAVSCDVAAPAITGAKLLSNVLEPFHLYIL